MAGLRDFTQRTHKIVLAEKLAGFHSQLTADHLLVKAVVTGDYHVVDPRLRAFYYPHFEVDGVAAHVTLDRHELEEQITVVHVEVRYGVIVLLSALVEKFLVVDISLVYAEYLVEPVGGIDGVAYPVYVVDIIFLAFAEVDVNVYGLIVVRHH